MEDIQFPSHDLEGSEYVNNNTPDFYIYSNSDWTIDISYSSGSGWVTGYPPSGSGDQAIFLGVADNDSGINRTATLTITYCGGLTATFTVYQSKGGDGNVITIIYDTIDPDINTQL